jgi:hypothetical protein
MSNFELTGEREATVQLSDTFSDVFTPPGAPPIPDFDSALTAQVRNTGRFEDLKSPVGQWPETGSYGAVLISNLREEQKRLLDVYEAYERQDLPDAQSLAKSLDKTVIGVINWAPRQQKHNKTGQNGEDFYLAKLDDNVIILSQLPFLRGVAVRGLVNELYRVEDDNPVWPPGEQFRSSIVSQLRNFPEGLEEQPLDILPGQHPYPLHLAFADKYGNGRIEKRADAIVPEIEVGKRILLIVEGEEMPVTGASRITDVPQDELGIYTNPADDKGTGPCYYELLCRVENPNDPRKSAYEKLRKTIMKDSEMHPKWSEVEIQLVE